MQTFQSAIDAFLRSRRSAGRKPKTIEWYAFVLGQFHQWLEAQDLPEEWLTPDLIEDWFVYRREHDGASNNTILNNWRALSALFNWMENRIPDFESPLHLVEKPAKEKKIPRRANIQMFDELLESIPFNTWIDYRDRLMVATLFLAAVRVGELVNLKLSDYDTEALLIKVPDGKAGVHLVPMLDDVKLAFVEYRFNRPPIEDEHVFIGSNGSFGIRGVLKENGVRQRLSTLCKRADLPYLNPHSFRHGLAMYLLNERGADLSTIQRILGHSRITTTSAVYAEWQTENIQKEFFRLMNERGEEPQR